MPDEQQLAILKSGVEAWNAWRQENVWRKEHPETKIDLTGADLDRADLRGAHLNGARLYGANLYKATLHEANLGVAALADAYLCQADLSRADLREADLTWVNLSDARLSGALLIGANLSGAHLNGADLRGAYLSQANLGDAALADAELCQADLTKAFLSGADLRGADLRGAFLDRAVLVQTHLEGANLTGCRIYGISAWDVFLERTKQVDLAITPPGQPTITVDNLEVAQFVYLLLNNEKIRDVIDTIGKKAVLILGRFTEKRKAVLDALRDELRKRDYLPILFDFDKPASGTLTDTIRTLAGMARFVIADLTDAKSLPQELMAIVPTMPLLAVQPLLLAGASDFALFEFFRHFPWVLPTYQYETTDRLLDALSLHVITPAEAKVAELRGQTPPETKVNAG